VHVFRGRTVRALVRRSEVPPERGKTVFLAELGKTGVHYLSTAQGLCSLGSVQAYRHGLRYFGASFGASVSRW
jgi:hypothetical protein